MSEWDSLRDEIYSNMELKTTEELQSIWENNDREEWSDTAFDVVRQILIHRTGEIPPAQVPHIKKAVQKAENKLIFKDRENRIIRTSTYTQYILIILYILVFFTTPAKNNKGYQHLSTYMFFLGLSICLLLSLIVTIYYAWINDVRKFKEWRYDQFPYHSVLTSLPRLRWDWDLKLFPDWLSLWLYRILGPIMVLLLLFFISYAAYTIFTSPFG